MKKMILMVFMAGAILSLTACDALKKWMSSKQQTQTALDELKEDNMDSSSASWAEKNKDFLEINKSKDGVQETASGLQYKVISEGQGASPKASDRVEVHYKGTLVNGNEFDSSYKRNATAQFGLNQVIPGWTEGLQLMKEGAVYEFYIPSRLAYGERNLPSIPSQSTLIFEVKLIKVL